MNNNDKLKTICTCLKEYGKVGPKLFQQLLIIYGNPYNIYDENPDELMSMTGMSSEKAADICASRDKIDIVRENIERLEILGINTISFFDEAYPDSVRDIADPPLVLYVKGELTLMSKKGVAVIGTAQPDQAGLRRAVDCAKALTRAGMVVNSGLAMGIDAAAHLGCLNTGGNTVAVLGCGHLNIYPDENIPLARLIAESGAVISEYDIHADAIKGRLIGRNRLIAALSDIVFIAQLGDTRRGELHAARAAIEQGKPVYIFDPDDKYDRQTLLDGMITKIGSIEQVDQLLEYN